MGHVKEYAITVILFIFFISGFMIASKFRISTGVISGANEKKNLGFESRAMSLLDSSDSSDIWTGKAGVDKLLISLAQESMYIEALDNGLSVPESQIDEYIRIHLNDTSLTFDFWNQTLAGMGISMGDARHRIRKTLLANENVKRMVLESINVTEDEIVEFFIQNRDKFTTTHPGAKNRLPDLNEVRSIINQTIRSRKMRASGQKYIDNMLNKIVETTLQSQNFSNITNQSDRMNLSSRMNFSDRINLSESPDQGMSTPLTREIAPIPNATSEKNQSLSRNGSNIRGEPND